MLAAREILRHVRAGGRYRDCAVIVRALEPYHAALARVFRRYEIPFFMDRRETVAHHPLAELTRFAFRTAWSAGATTTGSARSRAVWRRERREIDELENEALAAGWEGNVWRPLLPEGSRRFEELRRRLVAPFANFAAALAAMRPNRPGRNSPPPSVSSGAN